MSVDVERCTPDELLERCRKQRPDDGHEPYCFEIFRRAIVEQSQACWAAIYTQYGRLVHGWIVLYARSRDRIGDATVEDLVLDAFTAFWRAYGEDKLANARGVGSVLRYLKTCAAASVAQARRKLQRSVLQSEWQEALSDGPPETSPPVEQRVLARAQQDQLWQAVAGCCQDERDQIVARLSFMLGLKPQAILDLHPDLFADVTEIYRVRRNLKDRLKRSGELQVLLNRS